MEDYALDIPGDNERIPWIYLQCKVYPRNDPYIEMFQVFTCILGDDDINILRIPDESS
jgi:hypothetical protein